MLWRQIWINIWNLHTSKVSTPFGCIPAAIGCQLLCCSHRCRTQRHHLTSNQWGQLELTRISDVSPRQNWRNFRMFLCYPVTNFGAQNAARMIEREGIRWQMLEVWMWCGQQLLITGHGSKSSYLVTQWPARYFKISETIPRWFHVHTSSESWNGR